MAQHEIVETMADDLFSCKSKGCRPDDSFHCAVCLTNKGYRKANEVRKETAKEILQDLIGHTFENDGWTWMITKEDVQFLAEKFGVEITK